MSKKSMSRRAFLKHTLTAGAAVVAVSTGGCRGKDVPAWFDLTTLEMQVVDLPASFDGFRILHLTDIHHSPWMNRRRLMQLREFVLNQPIDLVVVTGDSTYHNESFQDLLDFYHELNANLNDPVLMIWGNHDLWDDAPINLASIFDNGVHLLSNDVYVVERGDEKLCVAGLDCAYEERNDLGKVLENLPEEVMPALLLAHEPDVAPAVAQTGRFFLQLSGHSHGGQICLPNGEALILPWLGERYPRGLYDVEGMMLYTSRGLGRGHPYLRAYCPAEAVIYTLRKNG